MPKKSNTPPKPETRAAPAMPEGAKGARSGPEAAAPPAAKTKKGGAK